MAELRTTADLLRVVGMLPAAYFDLVPSARDGRVALLVKRHYPAETPLAQVVTRDSKPAIACRITLVVDPPRGPASVCRVRVEVACCPLWDTTRLPRDPDDPLDAPAPDDPQAPTQDSMQRYRRAREPVGLTFTEDFLYDVADGNFYDDQGRVLTVPAIIDFVYDYHCRTLGWWAATLYRLQSAIRWLLRQAVWRGQDGCLWLLKHGYDFRLTEQGGWRRRYPTHRYTFKDFERVTDTTGAHFFGFQTSKRAIFANLLVLAVTGVVLYRAVPRWGLLRAIYNNNAVTTGALVMGFLVSDQVVPWALQALVCGLSRLASRSFSS